MNLHGTTSIDAMPSSMSPASVTRALADADEIPLSWFDRAPRQSAVPPRHSSVPPVQTMGGFLGDELADAWLR